MKTMLLTTMTNRIPDMITANVLVNLFDRSDFKSKMKLHQWFFFSNCILTAIFLYGVELLVPMLRGFEFAFGGSSSFYRNFVGQFVPKWILYPKP